MDDVGTSTERTIGTSVKHHGKNVPGWNYNCFENRVSKIVISAEYRMREELGKRRSKIFLLSEATINGCDLIGTIDCTDFIVGLNIRDAPEALMQADLLI